MRLQGTRRIALVWLAAAAALATIVALAPRLARAESPAEALTHARVFAVQALPRGGVTCFSVLAEGRPTATVYKVTNPSRVVIDLQNAAFQLPRRPFQVSGGAVSAFRYGMLRPSLARLVVDVAEQTAIADVSTVEIQANTFRLSIALGGDADEARLCRGDDTTHKDAVAAWGQRMAVDPARRRVVVIDPGHGGVDPGAVVNSVQLEKVIVLAVGRRLADVLKQRDGLDVVMTRTTDTFVSLDDRVAMTRSHQGDVFISLHADSLDSEQPALAASGATIYTLSLRASDEAAKRLANRENSADLLAGILPDAKDEEQGVRNILVDLLARETRRESVRLAQLLTKKMRGNVPLSDKPQRSAAFHVLKQTETPAVLIELGFMTNPHDLRLMRQSDWQDKMAAAIAEAVVQFLGHK